MNPETKVNPRLPLFAVHRASITAQQMAEVSARLDTEGTDVCRATPQDERLLNFGGIYDYRVIVGPEVLEGSPALAVQYAELHAVLQETWCPSVCQSPHTGSAVAVKRYTCRRGEQSLHKDTNTISALLWLNNCEWGGEIVFPGTGATFTPRQGYVLLFQGQAMAHYAKIPESNHKDVVCFNFYLGGEAWRPSGLDSMIYGEEQHY